MSLPPTRQLKKLGEILEVIRNGKACEQNKEKQGDKITRIETISDGTINCERVGYFGLDETDKEKFTINRGDILFSHINSPIHIGKVAIAKKNYHDLFHGMNLLLLRGQKDIVKPEYLFSILNRFFLKGDRERICKKAINQASLNQKNIIEKVIPLPPFPTQHAIVAKLDAVQAEITEAKQSTQAQIDALDALRQSGLSEVFENEKYEINKLSNICEFQNGYTFKSDLFREDGEPILRISNIQNNGFSDNRLVYFHLQDYDKSLDDFIVYPGDLVIAMSGATTGKLAINNTNRKYYLNQRVGKFIFEHDITKKFVHMFLITKISENLNQSAGSAIPNLSTEQIKDTNIPLPSLPEQKSIVTNLDQLSQQILILRTDYQVQLQQYDELWASTLDMAFRGELVKE